MIANGQKNQLMKAKSAMIGRGRQDLSNTTSQGGRMGTVGRGGNFQAYGKAALRRMPQTATMGGGAPEGMSKQVASMPGAPPQMSAPADLGGLQTSMRSAAEGAPIRDTGMTMRQMPEGAPGMSPKQGAMAPPMEITMEDAFRGFPAPTPGGGSQASGWASPEGNMRGSYGPDALKMAGFGPGVQGGQPQAQLASRLRSARAGAPMPPQPGAGQGMSPELIARFQRLQGF